MITEKEYLNAIQLIIDYRKQIISQVENIINEPIKRGDTIVFTKKNKASNLISIDKEYNIIRVDYRPINRKHNDEIRDKFNEIETHVHVDDFYETYNSIVRNYPHFTIITIRNDKGNHYKINTRRHYEYKIIR